MEQSQPAVPLEELAIVSFNKDIQLAILQKQLKEANRQIQILEAKLKDTNKN